MARRRRKKGRRKMGMPSIASVAVGVNALAQFGVLSGLMSGSPQGIVNGVINANNSTQKILMNTMNAAVPAVALKLARRYVGPVKAGPIRIL